MAGRPAQLDDPPGPFTIRVVGSPATQGSKIPGVTKDGKPYVREDNPPDLGRWRGDIVAAASALVEEHGGGFDQFVPVVLHVVYHLRRPDSYPRWIEFPVKKPDLDKLTRAVCDALKDARAYHDDAQVVRHIVDKVFARPGQPFGATIVLKMRTRSGET